MRVIAILVLCLATLAEPVFAGQQATVEHFVGAEGGIGFRDGRGSDARFNRPKGIWSNGTFAYVTDLGNTTIRRVTLAAGDVATIAGKAQQPQPETLSAPTLLWGGGGFLYFVDGVVIRRLALATGAITDFAGSTTGTTDGIGTGAQLRGPYAITGNSTDIFILDSPLLIRNVIWSSPALIRKISLSTGEVRTLPLPPVTSTALVYDVDPGALWTDDEFLYLAFVSAPGAIALGRMSLTTFEFTPLAGFPLPPADLRYLPRNLWSDGAGNFFFTDGVKILRFALSTGEFALVASAPPASGNSVGGLWGAGNTLVATDQTASTVFVVNTMTREARTLAGFAYTAPSADSDIRPLKGAGPMWHQGEFFYVADRNRYVIHRIAAGAGELSTFVSNIRAPGGIWGDDKFLYVTQSLDGSVSRVSLDTGEVSTLIRGFVYPTAIAGDSRYLYVVDRDLIIRISKTDGAPVPFSSDISRAGFRGIAGLWTDGSIIYVIDGFALRKIDLATLEVSILAGIRNTVTDVPGQPVFSFGLASLWSDGKFVYGGVTGAVQRFDPSTRQLQTLVGSPATSGFQDGFPDTVRMGMPSGIWTDAQYVYFLDNSLRRFNLATQEVTTWVGRALRISEGTVPPESFGASTITGGDGFLYATSGYAVYKISRATREITHVAGAFNESGTKDGIGSAARFADPRSLFNLGRDLFVIDAGMNAIRKVNLDTRQVTTIATALVFPRGLWAHGNYLYFVTLGYSPTLEGVYRIDLTTREVVRFFSGLPEAIGLWGDGAYLYVTGSNRTIRKISLSTREMTVLAGDPEPSPGAIQDRTGPSARFAAPNSIWGDGRLLYITDRSTVRTVHPVTGETHTIAGDATRFGTENGFAGEAHFDYYLDGIWGDGDYIYVGDRAIRRLTLQVLPVSRINFEVRSGGGNYWKSSAASAPAEPMQIGYARLQANAGSAPPDGVVVFRYRSQGVLVSEASVSASPLMQSGRVYAEMNSVPRTGIAIANPNDTSATIAFYFTNAAGNNFGNGTTTIAANQRFAAFLNEAPFNGTADAKSFTFAASVPVAAIMLRGSVNERSDFLMTTLPVAPIGSSSNSAVVLPHYASGGGWTTQILLVNPTDTAVSGTVEMDAAAAYFIPSRSAAKVVTSNAGSQVRTGLVRVTPASGSQAPVASSIFSFVLNGVTVTETGMTTTVASPSFRVFAEFNSAQSLRTGVAIANQAAASQLVRFELLDLDGQATGVSGESTLAANGHLALFLDELPGFRNLPPTFRGVLRVLANTPISVLGLRGRYNERGDFLVSATPALPDNVAATPGELVFPHIVTGGGYTSEFLLLSRGPSASGAVSLRSQSGAELALPIIK